MEILLIGFCFWFAAYYFGITCLCDLLVWISKEWKGAMRR
jgi:hypothetical protein